MGACLSPPGGPDGTGPPAPLPLFFHPYVKGSQIMMDESHRLAVRAATFHDGIVFSSRPVALHEKVALRVMKEEAKWHGGLRVGFTWQDPSLLEPTELPPFACPDLVLRGKAKACVLPEECGAEGTVVSFWADGRGRVFCSLNEEGEACLLLDGVCVGSPLWALVDVYGRAKAVQLLDPSSLLPNSDDGRPLLLTPLEQTESASQSIHRLAAGAAEDECAVCFGCRANTMMLPCAHASFCSGCSLRILRTSGRCPLCRQKVKKLVPATVSGQRQSPEG